MKLHRTINEVAGENTYYLENDHHLIVIDPGSDWEKIKEKIQEIDKPISAILLTHTHYDHILSLDLVRETFGQPPVYVAESEATWLFDPQMNLSGLPRHDDMEDVVLKSAEEIFVYDTPYDLDDFAFTVVQTPGHSIGGVSFIFPEQELVITGDALFRNSVGRTDLPTSNFDDLIAGIKNNLFTLPGHYKVYPGHGYSTTIAQERNFNPFFN